MFLASGVCTRAGTQYLETSTKTMHRFMCTPADDFFLKPLQKSYECVQSDIDGAVQRQRNTRSVASEVSPKYFLSSFNILRPPRPSPTFQRVFKRLKTFPNVKRERILRVAGQLARRRLRQFPREDGGKLKNPSGRWIRKDLNRTNLFSLPARQRGNEVPRRCENLPQFQGATSK